MKSLVVALNIEMPLFTDHMGVRQYACYASVITALGYALGYESGMHGVCIGVGSSNHPFCQTG